MRARSCWYAETDRTDLMQPYLVEVICADYRSVAIAGNMLTLSLSKCRWDIEGLTMSSRDCHKHAIPSRICPTSTSPQQYAQVVAMNIHKQPKNDNMHSKMQSGIYPQHGAIMNISTTNATDDIHKSNDQAKERNAAYTTRTGKKKKKNIFVAHVHNHPSKDFVLDLRDLLVTETVGVAVDEET